jgi:hypothetical protein
MILTWFIQLLCRFTLILTCFIQLLCRFTLILIWFIQLLCSVDDDTFLETRSVGSSFAQGMGGYGGYGGMEGMGAPPQYLLQSDQGNEDSTTQANTTVNESNGENEGVDN